MKYEPTPRRHRVDRAARIARSAAPIPGFSYKHNPRSLVEQLEDSFTWYLHEAMGYRKDQPEY